MTSALCEAPFFRITAEPSPANGLKTTPQIQVDKIITVPKERIGAVIGRLDDDLPLQVNCSMAVLVGIA